MTSAEATQAIETSEGVKALCRVVYVRCTPDELELLKQRASEANVSIQRYARTTLGLTDRGGYRYRKEQPNGKQAQPEAQTPETSLETSLPEGDSKSPVSAGDSDRVTLPSMPQQCTDQILPQT
jgi:hypothetical protein